MIKAIQKLDENQGMLALSRHFYAFIAVQVIS